MVVQTGAEAGLVAAVSSSGVWDPKRAHQCSATRASRASGAPAFSPAPVLAAEKNVVECEPLATPVIKNDGRSPRANCAPIIARGRREGSDDARRSPLQGALCPALGLSGGAHATMSTQIERFRRKNIPGSSGRDESPLLLLLVCGWTS